MTEDDLSRLEKLANSTFNGQRWGRIYKADDAYELADRAFIAACSPDVILDLIRRVKEGERKS